MRMRNSDVKNKRMSPKKAAALLSALLLFVYFIAAEITLQVMLVPSFMEKLDSFSDFTDKGYSEMIYTDDIVGNREEALTETQSWLQEKGVKLYGIRTEDDLLLIGAAFEQEDSSAPWALMLHGYTGWKEELYQHAYVFYQQGYSVLVPDLRAQGQSEGKYIGLGWADRDDLLEWLAAIERLAPGSEVVLYGQSMGGSAAVMLAADERLPENVKAAVSDSAFCDPRELFRRKLKDWTGLSDLGLINAAGLCFRLQGGYDLRDASALKHAPDCRVPVLFIHGSEDVMVPASDMDRLYEACGSEKQRLLIEGAGHIQAAEKDPKTYYETIFSFLDNYL